MTERFESTTALQKLFYSLPNVFGELVDGSVEEPAIVRKAYTILTQDDFKKAVPVWEVPNMVAK